MDGSLCGSLRDDLSDDPSGNQCLDMEVICSENTGGRNNCDFLH